MFLTGWVRIFLLFWVKVTQEIPKVFKTMDAVRCVVGGVGGRLRQGLMYYRLAKHSNCT